MPTTERSLFRKGAAERREYYAVAGCRYWLFEESGIPGAFLEFYEAPDEATLAAAHGAAPPPQAGAESQRIYHEVELT